MKFLPLPEFEDVTSSLNFDTTDCHITGGCDIYTTKAARSDRKLYNHIEQSLEAQYESVLRFSASLSPPNAHDAAETLNLSRSSPFGPLSDHSSRRTFAYLIATLNASHPDYDFSQVLRPTDFRRERNLKRVMNTQDHLLRGAPRVWKTIDEHMSLKECSIYSYSPEEDPSDADDGAIWSLHYFFFNPIRKRVCYIFLRAIPILSHTPDEMATTPTGKRTYDEGYLTPDLSSSKRAKFWFGERARSSLIASDSDDEMDRPPKTIRTGVDEYDPYVISDDDEHLPNARRGVRAMSEEIAASMEV
ncbi:hypothetical protein N7519_009094 [Penicillium mononematosum]|uniref:uncharacterized protein n=1 Tax=Penicillium mononematosum TaxID=268346 RepID=UPI002546767C|nr:uncharacterized protein N7519_009094 [Penicillium mononematosum]KAJ6178633.1 hypothetical protein N7519_009094 [Penicillium mononematosum]